VALWLRCSTGKSPPEHAWSLTLVPYDPSELASFQRAVLHYWDRAGTCFTLTSNF